MTGTGTDRDMGGRAGGGWRAGAGRPTDRLTDRNSGSRSKDGSKQKDRGTSRYGTDKLAAKLHACAHKDTTKQEL